MNTPPYDSEAARRLESEERLVQLSYRSQDQTPRHLLRQAFESRYNLITLREKVALEEKQWQQIMQVAIEKGDFQRALEVQQASQGNQSESQRRLVELMNQLRDLEWRYEASRRNLDDSYRVWDRVVESGRSADEVARAEKRYEAALRRNYLFEKGFDPDGVVDLGGGESEEEVMVGVRGHRDRYEAEIARQREVALVRHEALMKRSGDGGQGDSLTDTRRFAGEASRRAEATIVRYHKVEQRFAQADPAPAQASTNPPLFGNNEQDWPDPDIDSDAEDAAAITHLNEASMFISLSRQNRAIRGLPPFPEPDAQTFRLMLRPPTSFTSTERATLLTRGGLVGKALAYPERLSAEELHSIMEWPAPDVVSANIQQATNGVLSTPQELFQKVKEAFDRNGLDDELNQKEIALLARNFYESPATQYQAGESDHAAVAGAVGVVPFLLERMGISSEILYQARLTPDQRRAIRASQPPGGLTG